MKKSIPFFVGFLFFVGFYACQETDDVLLDEPRVRMVFYNIDSLKKVQSVIKIKDDSLLIVKDSLTSFDLKAGLLSGVIDSLGLLILEGRDDLVPLSEELTDDFDGYILLYEAFKVLQKDLNDSKKEWQNVINKINKGSIHLSSITNLANNKTVNLEDSSDVWGLPLSMNDDSVKVSIEIKGSFYFMGLKYKRLTIVDELSRLVVETSSLELIEYNDAEYENTDIIKFDSVKLKCKTQECIDSEASIAIYF